MSANDDIGTGAALDFTAQKAVSLVCRGYGQSNCVEDGGSQVEQANLARTGDIGESDRYLMSIKARVRLLNLKSASTESDFSVDTIDIYAPPNDYGAYKTASQCIEDGL